MCYDNLKLDSCGGKTWNATIGPVYRATVTFKECYCKLSAQSTVCNVLSLLRSNGSGLLSPIFSMLEWERNTYLNGAMRFYMYMYVHAKLQNLVCNAPCARNL